MGRELTTVHAEEFGSFIGGFFLRNAMKWGMSKLTNYNYLMKFGCYMIGTFCKRWGSTWMSFRGADKEKSFVPFEVLPSSSDRDRIPETMYSSIRQL